MVEFTLFESRRLNRATPNINSLINPMSTTQHSGNLRQIFFSFCFVAKHSMSVISSSRTRLIAKEGQINFRRSNLKGRIRFLRDLFTTLLDLPWLWILFLFVFCFVISWLLFAAIWYLIMVVHGDFSNQQSNTTDNNHIPCVIGVTSFRGAFLYSIETQQTIGYGTRAVTEQCTAGVFVLIIQSCFGLFIQALWVGLVYTKLSRPRKRRRTLIWSRQAVISLRDGFLTLQCRLADMRYRSTLVEAHIRMYFVSRRRTIENEVIPLHLLDMNVGFDAGKDRLFFNWPIVIEHKIDSGSPLYAMNKEGISRENFEILLVLEGIIEPTGMITQARTSYMPDEIVWGSRFQRMIHFNRDHYAVDFAKFNIIYNDNCTPDCSAKKLQEQRDNNN